MKNTPNTRDETFIAAKAILEGQTCQTEKIELDEEAVEIDMAKFKMLAKLGLLREPEVNLVVAGIKKMQSGEALASVVQTKVMAQAFVKLVSIITGDLSMLSKVKAALN